MSKFCETCGAALAESANICSNCGNSQSGEPLAATVLPVKEGPLILPKNGKMPLRAVTLVMIGAGGLFLNWLEFVIEYQIVSDVIWIANLWLLFASAIVLLVARNNGISLKIPMLIWGAGTIFGLISCLNNTIDFFTQGYDQSLYPLIQLLYGFLPVAAAAFMILYSFKIIKKKPAAVIVGILMAILLMVVIAFYFYRIVFSANPDHIPIGIFIRNLLNILCYLAFAIGIFLTVLAAKAKEA